MLLVVCSLVLRRNTVGTDREGVDGDPTHPARHPPAINQIEVLDAKLSD